MFLAHYTPTNSDEIKQLIALLENNDIEMDELANMDRHDLIKIVKEYEENKTTEQSEVKNITEQSENIDKADTYTIIMESLDNAYFLSQTNENIQKNLQKE